MGRKLDLLREKERIGQPSKGFREKSNTLIYSGSITPDLNALVELLFDFDDTKTLLL